LQRVGIGRRDDRIPIVMRGPLRWVLLVVLVVGLAVGGCLVFTGGESAPPPSVAATPSSGPPGTLPLGDTSIAGVEALSGLDIPDGATDFLTARTDAEQQLDVTFTIAPTDEVAFLAGSGLPPLGDEARVITHSSPLWKLNPGTPIRGAADVRGDVNRSVELTPEGDRIRVRVTLQPR
jgi:hypothetical protein